LTYLEEMKIIELLPWRLNGGERILDTVIFYQRDDFASERIFIVGCNSKNCDGNEIPMRKQRNVKGGERLRREMKLTNSDLWIWRHCRMQKPGCACWASWTDLRGEEEGRVATATAPAWTSEPLGFRRLDHFQRIGSGCFSVLSLCWVIKTVRFTGFAI